MKRLSIFIFVSALACSFPVYAASPSRQQEQSCPLQTEWVSAHLGDGESIVFPGLLGKSQISLTFDTGAPRTIVNAELAKQSGVPLGKVETIRAVGGAFEVRKIDVIDLIVGGTALRLWTAEAGDLASVNFGQSKFDVVIGRDVLLNCAIEINADENLVRIGEPSLDLSHASKVVIGYFGDDKFPYVPVKLGPDLHAIVGIDTGSQSDLFLDDYIWSKIDKRDLRETSVVVGGLGGFVIERLAFLPEMLIGTMRLRDVETRIQPTAPEGPDMGLIGLAFLARFNSVIDLKGGALWLVPRKTEVPPTPKSTSGVLALVVDDSRLQIIHIMQNSPAASAGLGEQDQICRIDGQPITGDYVKQPISGWSRGTPGRQVTLTLCDGRETILKLADFY